MDHFPIYKTRGGELFLFKTVPGLIRAIERLAAAQERLAVEREQRRRLDADA